MIDAWHATKASLPRTLGNVLFAQGFAYGVDVLKDHLRNASPHMTDLYVKGGVAIGLMILKTWRRKKEQHRGPYGYLTELVQAQNQFLQMAFPLSQER